MTALVSSTAGATALLAFADGRVLWGRGCGRPGVRVGELCFNTAMTGHQEILSDPSYAGQLITFTFPHIGNVGANAGDMEADQVAALGCIMREDCSRPSNYRSEQGFDTWLEQVGLIGLSGVDTRALTRHIRALGAPTATLAYDPAGQFDVPALVAQAKAWAGLEGMDLARTVTTAKPYRWEEPLWGEERPAGDRARVVCLDYGVKQNILRHLVSAGFDVTVVPATASTADILALQPQAIFLSNGPGDPAATGVYALPVIRDLLATGLPLFGICLGHQLLALAAGARTVKMAQGHRGANHPVQDKTTGRVDITVMNHGFTVSDKDLPATIVPTHLSLFDGSVCGLRLTDRPAFSLQHHPEASPGPQEAGAVFRAFRAMVTSNA